ncbi:MAG: CDP-diacylglycerol--serine O-phosphatidyltransferase [Bacteroidales bacterium]|nr:CDP-diacylglycerol--serine O-phosphatidyltransferase [Bacteroidales bacterium]
MQIKKFIPNTITLMNLLCGSVGVIFALEGRPDIAFWLMLAAAVFDFCDGFAARLLHAYSDIGKELDSLSDLISFGLLPSVMLYGAMADAGAPRWACFVPLLIAALSALRLAKFNLDERQHESFLGLPTPACAMVCGSLAYYVFVHPESRLAALCGETWFLPVLALGLGLLLVSEIPMFSMKFGKGAKPDVVTQVKRIAFLTVIVLIAATTAILRLNWSLIPLGAFLAYILENLLFLLYRPK